ncbi:MAG: hypothetical protein JXJ19_01245 [Elusimicrobia bacterium]|nr:hypothetical protein [Elusimicrobiota bacterium]
MREDIKNLLELQRLDTINSGIDNRIKEIPELIKQEQETSREFEQKVENAKNELNQLNLDLKNKELELRSTEDAIRKLKEQLNTLKSNEAYTKMQKEISDKDGEVGVHEEAILMLYDSIEAKQKEIEDLKGHLEAKKAEIKQNEDKFAQEIEALNNNKKEVEIQIAPLKEKIEPELLGLYIKVRNVRKGIAVVEVGDSSCGGCHMQLPPQIINDVLTEDKLVQCENCNRFLYIRDE